MDFVDRGIMIQDYLKDALAYIKYYVFDNILSYFGYEPKQYVPDSTGMWSWVYDENDPHYVEIVKIVVKDEANKKQVLLASKYLHDLRNIDTNLQGINSIVHLYEHPDLIEVSQ